MLEQISPENSFLNSPFTPSELLQGIRQHRCGKSPGIDKIINEMIESSPEILYKPIMYLFNQIWKVKTLPQLWATSIIIPLHKSGP